MSMYEYAQMDQQWLEEARLAVSRYRQGQATGAQIAQTRATMKAG